MIYFKDELSYAQEFRIDSERQMIEIRHFLDEDKDEDDSVDHDIVITGASIPETSDRAEEIRLLGNGKTPLSEIAKAARACIYHHNGGRATTSIEFMRNYKSILLGEYAGWELKEIIVRPTCTKLDYIDEDGTWERIIFEKCTFDLTFDIPCEKSADEEDEENMDGEFGPRFGKLAEFWRNRDNAAHGIPPSSGKKQGYTETTPRAGQKHSNIERIIIRYDPDKERTEIWTGRVDEGINNGLRQGQRMLSVEYDEDDDIVATRHYHEQDLSDELLELVLDYNSEQQIFCL